MVEAGETGGVLDLILQRLATLIEKVVKLKRSIVSASIYPAAVILVAIAAIAVIMVVVIPQFEQIFIGLLGPGELLPLPTRIVMGISGFLAGWGGLALLVALIGSRQSESSYYYKTEKGRWQIDTLLLKTADLRQHSAKDRGRTVFANSLDTAFVGCSDPAVA